MIVERAMIGELSELLELAKRAADSAAAVHRSALEGSSFKVYAKTSSSDLVTEIDGDGHHGPPLRLAKLWKQSRLAELVRS